MERSASIRADSDTFSKSAHTASLTNIAKFVEQMKQFVNPNLKITEDRIYIFILKHPLMDDEIGALRHTEQERRSRLHNMLRPKNMDPATHQQILMVVRQVAPKVRKLDRQDYYLYGEEMLQDLSAILGAYHDYTNIVMGKTTARTIILLRIDHLLSALSILSEVARKRRRQSLQFTHF